MESLMTKSALATDHLAPRTATATEKAEIDHLRQILNQGHYLQAGRPAGHGLWSVENKNHWRRDTSLGKEDDFFNSPRPRPPL